jgi:LPS export ABC transporter protein LptC
MYFPFRRGLRAIPPRVFFAIIWTAVLGACTFDYGSQEEARTGPDIVMRDIEYVRVRDGDPLARFRADQAERWEKTQIMSLEDFTFEQFEDSGQTVNARGKAGTARVELSSGDVNMSGGVLMEVDSEDFSLETATLRWEDGDRKLSGGEFNPVSIERSDGTSLSGVGLSAEVRSRKWQFSGAVEGTWVHTEEETEEETDDDE